MYGQKLKKSIEAIGVFAVFLLNAVQYVEVLMTAGQVAEDIQEHGWKTSVWSKVCAMVSAGWLH